ncbi:phospholipase D-like domain-containing protein [Rhizobium laguerreae]|uniref:Phospholipase D-like protein n=1 Tax=Rhizobium laguerreae TaxID=1076926 RepID=A0AAX2QT50_9HYPH|nr:phospholipase D-like domain-containing protein [Rhizobium laguerreae]TCU29932.1 phospholipase D-like protein [Rhizobium laguerreae]
MGQKEFILQGFTGRTHKDAIHDLFAVANIEKVLLSVAFVSESGVQQIEGLLTKHGAALSVFAGIRNDITSYQGLSRLSRIDGSTLYAVDTGSRNVVFHPKMYLVRGTTESRLIVGSANLTLGGLNNNVEAGLLVILDMSDDGDKDLVDQIEAEFAKLPEAYPSHVLLMDSVAKLDALLATGRVTDEMALPPPKPNTSGGASGADAVPRIALIPPTMRRSLKPALPAPAAPALPVPTQIPAPAPKSIGVSLELMWESKALTERDLNIPKGMTTNKTGSVNLDKGLLPEQTDHRHYFRHNVFNALTWSHRSPTVDETYAMFQFVLKGVSYGDFNLAVRHSTSTTSTSYLQNNAMTRLSWGPVVAYVADPSLIGRTLALYRDKADPTKFVLEID